MTREATWTCPVCRRTVPGRVDDCYCGTTRETADRMKDREARAHPGGPPWSAIGLVFAAGLVVTLGFLGGASSPEPEPAPTLTPRPRPSTPVRRPATPTPRPRGRPWKEPAPVATPVAESIPVLRPEPVEEPTPEPTVEPTEDPNSMEARRAEGEKEFRAALDALDLDLALVDRKLKLYQNGCGTSTDVVQPGGCGMLEVELVRLLDGIDRSVAAAEEGARRSWVQPGTQRDILRQRQLDSSNRDRLRREIESALR